MVTIESTEGHQATVRVRGLAGHIRYWLAECINDDHNCIHANPWSGDLAAGGVTEWRGVLYLLRGSVEDVAAEVAKREGIT